MYTTEDNMFILFPAAGGKLNEERLFSPSTSMSEKDANLFAKMMIECSYFSEVSRFANITNNDELAKNYLKEYFSELKACNKDKDVYKSRMPLSIPLINSVHIQLTKAMAVKK